MGGLVSMHQEHFTEIPGQHFTTTMISIVNQYNQRKTVNMGTNLKSEKIVAALLSHIFFFFFFLATFTTILF